MIERKIYYELNAQPETIEVSPDRTLRFAIEGWFMPIDGPQESMSKIAFVIGDRTVLASKSRALEISAAIAKAANA